MMKRRFNFRDSGLIFTGLVYQKNQSEKSGQSQQSKFRHCWAFALLLLLAGCGSEDMGGGDPVPDPFTDEWVPVRFTVGEAGFGDSEAVTRSALMNGDAPVGLRSDTLPLGMGIKVRIVLYTGYGYSGHVDYEATIGGLLIPYPSGSPELSAPMGTNRFVAYSFNSSSPMDPFEGITAPITGSQEVLWGDTLVTVSHGAMDVHITMQHKMSRVVVHATAENLFSMNSIDAEIYCYEPTLNVANGVMNPNGSLVGRPFVWNITDPALLAQTSDTLYVFTNAAPVTGLQINSMSINGIAYTDPRYASYTKPLEAGKSYTLHVNFTRAPSGGSASRITWEPPTLPTYSDGRYIITNDPRDAGLHFKFGSVVGVFTDVDPGSNTGRVLRLPGQSTDPNFSAPRDIAWNPRPFLNPISSWTDIPVYMSGDFPGTVTPQDNYHTTANVMAGKGDPCRLVGLDLSEIRKAADSGGSLVYAAIDNGVWRLPTVQENLDFTGYNSANPGDWWWSEGQQPGNISFGVAGAEFPARNQGGTSRFLPAAGLRDSYSNSDLMYTGVWGFYWTNELFSGSPVNGFMMFFYQTASDPTQFGDANNGYSVRCVRQTIEFEIEVNDWISGGTLGLGGEGDIVVY